MLVGYMARLGVTLAGSLSRGGSRVDAPLHVPFFVWPNDIDVMGHVNNGRYLTLMDLGRFDHVVRTGLLLAMVKRGWSAVAGEAHVQFLRELKPLDRCSLRTCLAHWDAKWLYFEHTIERRGEPHARGAVRVVVKHKRRTVPPAEVLATVGHTAPSPGLPAGLSHWMSRI